MLSPTPSLIQPPKRTLFNPLLNKISPTTSYRSAMCEGDVLISGNPKDMTLENLALRASILSSQTDTTDQIVFNTNHLNIESRIKETYPPTSTIPLVLSLMSQKDDTLLTRLAFNMITIRLGKTRWVEIPKPHDLFWNNRDFNCGSKIVIGFKNLFKVPIRNVKKTSKHIQILESVNVAEFFLMARDWTVIRELENKNTIYIPKGTTSIVTPGVLKEGTWGPVNPQKLTGDWTLTGKGKKIITQSDGIIIECEGIWGPADPKNPSQKWELTGKGSITEFYTNGTNQRWEGVWKPMNPQDPTGPWDLVAET